MTRASQLAAVAQNRNTEQVRQAVFDRANAGMSYTDIAADLGVSRGIISGIVYRGRKAGMTFPKTRAPSAPKADKPKAKRAPAAKPATLLKIVPPANWFPVRLTIMQLRDGVCRWPLWDAGDKDKFYCGLPATSGSVYCAHCRAVSVAPRATASLDEHLGLSKIRRAA